MRDNWESHYEMQCRNSQKLICYHMSQGSHYYMYKINGITPLNKYLYPHVHNNPEIKFKEV